MADLIPLFFDEKEIVNADYETAPTFKFDFGRATGAIIKIDAGSIEFSLDGRNRHGKLVYADNFIALDFVDFSKIWFKGSGTVRFWAWLCQ